MKKLERHSEDGGIRGGWGERRRKGGTGGEGGKRGMKS
jgi:hypothetical protein